MTKALVIGCADPRMAAQFQKVRSIVRTDEAIPFLLPGPDGLFHDPAREGDIELELEAIRKLLFETGPFDVVAVLAHSDCDEHPASIETHRQDVRLSAMQIRDRLHLRLPVQAVLAIRGETDDDWEREDLGRF